MTAFALSAYDADVLTASRELADYFESCATLHANAKAVSNWVMGEITRRISFGMGVPAQERTDHEVLDLIRLADFAPA